MQGHSRGKEDVNRRSRPNGWQVQRSVQWGKVKLSYGIGREETGGKGKLTIRHDLVKKKGGEPRNG